jgi:hypothetical protein
MNLTLREGYWIQFCMKLTAVMSHDNYYSQFWLPSCVFNLRWCGGSRHAIKFASYKFFPSYKQAVVCTISYLKGVQILLFLNQDKFYCVRATL